MQYEKLLLEMLERISDLESRLTVLEQKRASAVESEINTQEYKASKKYRYLSKYIQDSEKFTVRLSFEQIEDILQFQLPDSARKHKEFWANTTSHSIALSWLSVGYKTVEVNLEQEYVVFEKSETNGREINHETEWRRKNGSIIYEIEKVFSDFKNEVELDSLTYQKQYLGVKINGKNKTVIKFRPKVDYFFIEVYDKSHTGNKLQLLQEKGLPIVYLDDPKDEPKRYYYRVTIKNYDDYLKYREDVNLLVKYCYNLSTK